MELLFYHIIITIPMLLQVVITQVILQQNVSVACSLSGIGKIHSFLKCLTYKDLLFRETGLDKALLDRYGMYFSYQ